MAESVSSLFWRVLQGLRDLGMDIDKVLDGTPEEVEKEIERGQAFIRLQDEFAVGETTADDE